MDLWQLHSYLVTLACCGCCFLQGVRWLKACGHLKHAHIYICIYTYMYTFIHIPVSDAFPRYLKTSVVVGKKHRQRDREQVQRLLLEIQLGSTFFFSQLQLSDTKTHMNTTAIPSYQSHSHHVLLSYLLKTDIPSQLPLPQENYILSS